MHPRLVLLSGLLASLIALAANAAVTATGLTAPPGFHVELFASNVPNVRQLAVSSDGLVFAGSREAGKIYAIIDRNHDFVADEVVTIADDLHLPSGIALHQGALYVGAVERILRYDDIAEHYREHPQPVVLPARLPHDEAHGWKYLGFGPDGMLYVPVGAPCNICLPNPPYGSILRMQPDGRDVTVYATGIRNSVGFAWHPVTGELWFTDNGRDWLGDDSPSCELNRVTKPGQHFGFPFIHGGGTPDPEFGVGRNAKDFVPPAVKLGAHVAPLGVLFYHGKQFPAEFRRSLLIAEHGSWNRSRKVGYRVVRLELDAQSEVIRNVPFVTGWLQNEEVSGRPADVAELSDGSVLISDDTAGVIYRVRYGAADASGATPR